MKYVNSLTFVSFFLISFITNSFAQNCVLSMAVSSTPVTQLSPADIDFEHFESRNLLFTANIMNPSSDEIQARIGGTLKVDLADGTQFDNAVTFLTVFFPVRANGTKIITNLNIGKQADIKLEDYSYADEAKKRFQDIALSTGKFPAGTYRFILKLYCQDVAEPIQTIEITFVLQNLSRIELRSPRNNDMTNEFPFFEFFYEGDRADIIVAERTPDQTREDAITRSPAMLKCVLNPNQNFYLYGEPLPFCTDLYRPLEQGKTYVWRIISKSRSIGGSDIELPSEIYQFTVSSSLLGGPESILLIRLEEIFGQKFKSIFNEIKENGLTPGIIYSHNNQTMGLSELLNLINELRDIENVALTLE